jgi:hypothetical protein
MWWPYTLEGMRAVRRLRMVVATRSFVPAVGEAADPPFALDFSDSNVEIRSVTLLETQGL